MATKTTFDILAKVSSIIKVVGVTTTIDGQIYRRKKPKESKVRDIVLTTLPIQDEIGSDLQTGVMFINCYAVNDGDGIPDETKLKATTDAVITAVEAYVKTNEFFQMKIIDESLLPDNNAKGMSFMSLRVEYYIES